MSLMRQVIGPVSEMNDLVTEEVSSPSEEAVTAVFALRVGKEGDQREEEEEQQSTSSQVDYPTSPSGDRNVSWTAQKYRV